MSKEIVVNEPLDSYKDFFNTELGNMWKKKSGLYLIEQPLIVGENNKRIFKLGYARHSLYTRMGDYRLAYGPVSFKIYRLLEVPAGVLNKRSNYHLLSEQRLHATLKKLEVNTKWNEWYYDLNILLDVFDALIKEFEKYKWIKWDKYKKLTRTKSKNLVGEKEIKSYLFDDVIYKDRSHLKREQNK